METPLTSKACTVASNKQLVLTGLEEVTGQVREAMLNHTPKRGRLRNMSSSELPAFGILTRWSPAGAPAGGAFGWPGTGG